MAVPGVGPMPSRIDSVVDSDHPGPVTVAGRVCVADEVDQDRPSTPLPRELPGPTCCRQCGEHLLGFGTARRDCQPERVQRGFEFALGVDRAQMQIHR